MVMSYVGPREIGPYDDWDVERLRALATPRGDRAVAFTIRQNGRVDSTGRYGPAWLYDDLRNESDLLDEISEVFRLWRPEGGRCEVVGREIRFSRNGHVFAVIGEW
ncbi:hypothetical protein [Microbacterium sp. B35-04]|jgi:hypothetical protein|uniref:hypothetical protein n=1 Tax=Microbacterium sp. B35-04 TaxID=1961716 RepID=UPI0013D80165|nr:hypothetical protein [Microbacterium sp. B35-04]